MFFFFLFFLRHLLGWTSKSLRHLSHCNSLNLSSKKGDKRTASSSSSSSCDQSSSSSSSRGSSYTSRGTKCPVSSSPSRHRGTFDSKVLQSPTPKKSAFGKWESCPLPLRVLLGSSLSVTLILRVVYIDIFGPIIIAGALMQAVLFPIHLFSSWRIFFSFCWRRKYVCVCHPWVSLDIVCCIQISSAQHLYQFCFAWSNMFFWASMSFCSCWPSIVGSCEGFGISWWPCLWAVVLQTSSGLYY